MAEVNENFNIIDGGIITHDDGTEVEIEANPNRVTLYVLGNTTYEFMYHPDGVEGLDPSDVLEWSIKPADKEKPIGFYLNVQDAMIIIEGLSRTSNLAIIDGVPLDPEDISMHGDGQ